MKKSLVKFIVESPHEWPKPLSMACHMYYIIFPISFVPSLQHSETMKPPAKPSLRHCCLQWISPLRYCDVISSESFWGLESWSRAFSLRREVDHHQTTQHHCDKKKSVHRNHVGRINHCDFTIASGRLMYRWRNNSSAVYEIHHEIHQLYPLKAPFIQGCDPRATFQRPEKVSRRSVVAQTQKVLFLCNCCGTTLVPSLNHQNCCGGTTGRTKETEWRQKHCHGGSRVAWSSNGGTVAVTMIAHWMLLVGKGGTVVGQGRKKHRSNLYTMFTTVNIFTGRTMTDPSTSILRPRPCVCLPPASFARPASDRPPLPPVRDCFEHAQKHGEVWTSCVPPLNVQGNHSASFVPSSATRPVLWSHKGGTKVAAPV